MNNKPKISPNVMKAAAQIANLSPIHLSGPRLNLVKRIEKIIDATTHLTAKETALKELMEAVKEYRQKSYAYQISSITQEHYLIAVHALDAAEAKARESLKS